MTDARTSRRGVTVVPLNIGSCHYVCCMYVSIFEEYASVLMNIFLWNVKLQYGGCIKSITYLAFGLMAAADEGL